MEKRFLGRSGLEVSAFSFGVMTFGSGEGPFASIGSTGADDAGRQVDIALECGVTLFDTSDNYSQGLSEQMLSHALGDRRNHALIATKVFGRTGGGERDIGLSRKHITNACEASLKRLGTDRIDLYQVHNFDSLVPMEETLRALDDLVRAGKVRYIGCSNHFAWQMTSALCLSERRGLAPYVSQQIQYSLLVRDAEMELLPAAVAHGAGSLIYSPLAQGYLSGKHRAGAQANTRLGHSTRQFHAFDGLRGRAIVETLIEIATSRSVSASQVALNWVRTRAGVTSVIIGARSEAQLLDNLAAADWNLTVDEVQRLDSVSATPLTYPAIAQQIFHSERNPSLFPRARRKSDTDKA